MMTGVSRPSSVQADLIASRSASARVGLGFFASGSVHADLRSKNVPPGCSTL